MIHTLSELGHRTATKTRSKTFPIAPPTPPYHMSKGVVRIFSTKFWSTEMTSESNELSKYVDLPFRIRSLVPSGFWSRVMFVSHKKSSTVAWRVSNFLTASSDFTKWDTNGERRLFMNCIRKFRSSWMRFASAFFTATSVSAIRTLEKLFVEVWSSLKEIGKWNFWNCHSLSIRSRNLNFCFISALQIVLIAYAFIRVVYCRQTLLVFWNAHFDFFDKCQAFLIVCKNEKYQKG